jgi:hypothetical protein
MNRNRGIRVIRVMTMAWLLAAAGSGTALAQHVVGGMGEPVRMGAFDGHGVVDSQAGQTGVAPGKGRARARTTDSRHPPAASTRGGVPALPGKHLP